MLIVQADRAMATTAASIYVATVLLSFGTSAAYHRLARSERSRRIMQRLDHAMIYLLITGTYVPASLMGLPPARGIPLLSVVATGALIGIVLKIVAFEGRAAWVAYSLYPALGWAAVVVLPVLVDHLSTPVLMLILGGGVSYTIGFPVLLLKRPDPWPEVFGYHEVWHAFTIVAAVMHFGAVAALVT